MLHIGWKTPEVPDFDPEIHNPEKVLLLCVIVGFTMRSGCILTFSIKENGNLKIQEEGVDLSSFFVHNKE